MFIGFVKFESKQDQFCVWFDLARLATETARVFFLGRFLKKKILFRSSSSFSYSYLSRQDFFVLYLCPVTAKANRNARITWVIILIYIDKQSIGIYLHKFSCQRLVCNHRDTSNHKNQECCDSCVHKNEPLSYIRLYLRDKKVTKISVDHDWFNSKTDNHGNQFTEMTDNCRLIVERLLGQSARQVTGNQLAGSFSFHFFFLSGFNKRKTTFTSATFSII